MIALLIYVAVISWVSFIAFAADRRRELLQIHGGKISTGLLYFLAIIAPVGALGSMLLFKARAHSAGLWVVTLLFLALLCLLAWFL